MGSVTYFATEPISVHLRMVLWIDYIRITADHPSQLIHRNIKPQANIYRIDA